MEGFLDAGQSAQARTADPRALLQQSVCVNGEIGVVTHVVVRKGASTRHTVTFTSGKVKAFRFAKTKGNGVSFLLARPAKPAEYKSAPETPEPTAEQPQPEIIQGETQDDAKSHPEPTELAQMPESAATRAKGEHQGDAQSLGLPPTSGQPERAGKFSSPVQHFKFGRSNVFLNGLAGFVTEKELTCSIEHECTYNDGGLYRKCYEYVVLEPAKEMRHQDKCTGLWRIKDRGHNGWRLERFASLEIATKAGLKLAHCAVIRMYTGELFRPLNRALRALVGIDKHPEAKEALLKWATCVSVLYDGILLLSHQTSAMTVWRGLDESNMTLPASFIDPSQSQDDFAGGVEMGFMSTTRFRDIAMQFSGNHC
jgi:hypothetical protein